MVPLARRHGGGIDHDHGHVVQDHDVAGAGAHRQRPHDLVQIERVDVGVDHDQVLQVHQPVRRRQGAQCHALGEAGETVLDRDDAGEPVLVQGVDRHHLGKLFLQLGVDRRRGVQADQGVVLGPAAADVDVLEDRVLAVRDGGHLEHRRPAHAAVGTGELAERALEITTSVDVFGLDDDLGMGLDVQTVAGLGQRDRRAHHGRGVAVLGLVVADRRGGEHGHGRVVAEHDGDLQRLAGFLRCLHVPAHVVDGHAHQRELVRAMRLDAVDADVLLAEVVRVVGVAADDVGLADVVAAVEIVDAVQRQDVVQVDVAFDAHLVHRRLVGLDPFELCLLRAPAIDDVVEHRLDGGALRVAEQHRQVGPAAVHAGHQPLVGVAADLVEQDGRRAGHVLTGGHADLTDVRLRHDRVRPGDALAVAVEQLEEVTQRAYGRRQLDRKVGVLVHGWPPAAGPRAVSDVRRRRWAAGW